MRRALTFEAYCEVPLAYLRPCLSLESLRKMKKPSTPAQQGEYTGLATLGLDLVTKILGRKRGEEELEQILKDLQRVQRSRSKTLLQVIEDGEEMLMFRMNLGSTPAMLLLATWCWLIESYRTRQILDSEARHRYAAMKILTLLTSQWEYRSDLSEAVLAQIARINFRVLRRGQTSPISFGRRSAPPSVAPQAEATSGGEVS